MNENRATSEMRLWWTGTLVPLLISALSFSSYAWGQTPAWLDNDRAPAQAREALAEHMSSKYRVESTELQAIPRDERVVWRHFSVSGDLNPKQTPPSASGEHGKARAMAQAFLQEEAFNLLGISASDIRIEKVVKGMPDDVTQTVVVHQIYVDDLPFDGARVNIGLDRDDRIVRVSASLAPIPDALRQTAKRPTLGEQRIRSFVQADIEADAKSPDAPYPVKRYPTDPHQRSTEAQKLAIPTPPYVIWRVRSIWEYDIDAYTGKILSKTPGWADAK